MKLKRLIAAMLMLFVLLLFLNLLLVKLQTPLSYPPVILVHDKPVSIHLTFQNDPRNSITVMWQTANPNTGDEVLFDNISRGGISSFYRYKATGVHRSYVGATGYIHQVELTNLSPDTTYYFICGGPGNYGEERAFRTAPDSASSFTFVCGGDSRTNEANRVLVSKAMRHANPVFVLHSGDMVEDGRIQEQWDSWFADVNDNWIGDNGLTIPIIPCLGNHEHNSTNYYEQFALPGNEQWYYMDWGPNLRIIVLNGYASQTEISTEQVNWLNNTLTNTPVDKWKIVMFHQNVYYSGGHGNATNLIEYWVPLFDQYHVDIVFQGHTHHYHRTKPMYNNTVVASYQQGTMYLTNGCWGAPFHPYIPQTYSDYGNVTLCFTQISIFQNGTLHLETKDINGYTIDSYLLTK
ncbi:MAG: metallophosphoesterase family protein [Candidatus Freyarchaeota archaeon]|nr:metallophosphoesterase family protein [Candidatus Jordarchaeia archaeon]MBS7269386.1 metallophosphoesterase family protein [Candidatus Jordarchaeia archaeon]MBS7280687.1 metallophosphoesterase family protein [Candidatus Jordarchaeia archaeon]